MFPPPTTEKAFSLLELLSVMAIIAMLAVAAYPAFNSIAAAHGLRQATYDLSGLLELARSEAVAKQTFVWVGVDMTNTTGKTELLAAAVYSRDGSANTNASNLAGLIKTLRVRNTSLVPWDNLKAATRDYYTNSIPTSVATNTAGIGFSVGQSQYQSKTLTFTPRGEVLLKGSPSPDDGFIPCIDISFRQTRGGVTPPDADDAAIVIDGATGTPRIIRIQ